MIFNSTKGRERCRDFIYEYDVELIECMRKNEVLEIVSFCTKWVDSRLCKSIFFTKETMEKIEALHVGESSEEDDKDDL